jgi:hypothetical protein
VSTHDCRTARDAGAMRAAALAHGVHAPRGAHDPPRRRRRDGQVSTDVRAPQSSVEHTKLLECLHIRMPEPIVLPHTDERFTRTPRTQRLRHEPVDAAMVGDFHHIDGSCEAPEHSLLGPRVRVSQEQRLLAVPLHEQHHARVVGVEPRLLARRPQHAHVPAPDTPRHAVSQAFERRLSRGSVERVRLCGVGILSCRRGHTHPSHCRHARQTLQAARVVVSEHQSTDPGHPRARHGPTQRQRVRPAVDEHGLAPVLDEHGVALADVEHDDPGRRRSARPHQYSEQNGGAGQTRPDPPDAARQRPGDP